MRARVVPSRRLAILFVLALGLVLGAVLLSQSARVPLRTPLVPRPARAAPVSVPLEGREARGGGFVFRAELVAADLAALLAHEEIQLFFESDGEGRTLAGGELRVRGRGCAFAALPRDALDARRPTTFVRGGGCAAPAGAAGPASLDLALEVSGRGGIAILAFTPEGGAVSPIQLPAPRTAAIPLDLRGALVSYPPRAARLALLAHMWRNEPGQAAILALVALAIALACAGCLLFPTGPRPATGPGGLDPAGGAPRLVHSTNVAAGGRALERGQPPRRVARAAIGAGLCALSLALLHAVLYPPLGGPDEPYHLMGFAELTGDPALAQDTIALMGETHLWRIRQQPAEHFRTIDVGKPYLAEDDQLRPTEVAMRSALLARVWSAAAPIARGRPAHRALFALRLLNAVLFALAVGAAAALALLLVAEPFAQWLVYPFLFVPALPFFAVHVSETAVLCGAYVLLAASVGAIALDGPRAHLAGPPLGLATGLMLAGGRSPWPLGPLVAAVLAGRVLLGSTPRAESPDDAGSARVGRLREPLVFWVGFGLGATTLFLLQGDEYRTMIRSFATHFTAHVPGWLRELGLRLVSHPSAFLALSLAAALAEVALRAARERLAGRFGERARPLVSRIALALAVAVVASLTLSLVVPFPELPLERQFHLTAADRVRGVLLTTATMFRLARPDFQLASSFWVGFGWLDTMPGPAFQGLLVALTGAALVTLLRHVARTGEARRLLWLILVALGGAGTLVVYTLATQGLITSLTGRYLIGLYLVVLAVCAGGLVLDGSRAGGARTAASGSLRAAALLAIAGVVHAYSLYVILRRYF
jgi:hypothetical protein